MEYCGEVITPDQFEERKKQYTNEKRRHYYFMSLRSDEVHLHYTCTMYIVHHNSCMSVYNVHNYMYVSVAVPRQDSMSPARANAVLSGHCNRFVGYP